MVEKNQGRRFHLFSHREAAMPAGLPVCPLSGRPCSRPEPLIYSLYLSLINSLVSWVNFAGLAPWFDIGNLEGEVDIVSVSPKEGT